jgi:L-alanine-DL-glutamate epimerase-like enolase superfamily enzyme
MKISKVTVTPVNIPLETPFFWTGGYYPGTSKAIIQVDTDEGITGLGVVLDREALERWHRHYVERGPMDHFYNPDRPGNFKRLPLN